MILAVSAGLSLAVFAAAAALEPSDGVMSTATGLGLRVSSGAAGPPRRGFLRCVISGAGADGAGANAPQDSRNTRRPIIPSCASSLASRARARAVCKWEFLDRERIALCGGKTSGPAKDRLDLLAKIACAAAGGINHYKEIALACFGPAHRPRTFPGPSAAQSHARVFPVQG